MMVGTSEFERLADYYKGQSTESVLLNIAGRLAAQQHLILKNPKIPNATAVKMAKPMAQDQGWLTRVVGGPLDEESQGVLINMLRKIIKRTTPKLKAVLVKPKTATTTKKEKRLLP